VTSSELIIWIGFAALIACSGIQLVVAYKAAANIRRDDLFHRPDNHWPFIAITIIFPLLVSGLPLLAKFPEAAAGTTASSGAPNFLAALDMAINYFIVLITVEFGLLASMSGSGTWQQLLVVTTVLDLSAYIFCVFVQARVHATPNQTEPSWPTMIYLVAGCFVALLASLYTIVAAHVAGVGRGRVVVQS
jgi:hypothetical protein